MSTITLHGTIEPSTMGSGVWSLVTPEGSYEIYAGAPDELLQSGLNATVTGRIRDDVMSIAMIGPILEITSFEISAS